MTSLKIESATKNDMNDVANIICSSAKWYEPFLAEKDLDEHYVGQEWIDKNYKKRNFFVGKNEEGETIGTISTQYFGDQTYLGYIYLDANQTGQGFGKKLIEFAEEDSRKRGQKSMILIAHPEASWATKAYERYGFERIAKDREDVISYRDGILKDYYEEGFHLYRYSIN